jgi:hypothetical protein
MRNIDEPYGQLELQRFAAVPPSSNQLMAAGFASKEQLGQPSMVHDCGAKGQALKNARLGRANVTSVSFVLVARIRTEVS